jgi:diguanylate cyclase (GGDEF)-like protein
MNVLGWLRWREGARIIAIEGRSLTETGRAGMADIAADAGSVARRRYEARLRPSIELLEGLLKRQPFLAGMNIAIGALAALALSGAVPTAWLLGWLACLLASQAPRFALLARYRRRVEGLDRRSALGFWLTAASAVAGVTWGLFGLLFDGFGHPTQILVPFMLAGMAGGAMTALPSHPPAFLAFVLPALLPYALRLLCAGDRASLLMSATVLVYIAATSAVALELNRALRQAARLHWSNTRLVTRLERSRRELERRVEQRTAELQAVNDALVGEVDQRRRSEERVRHLLAHDPLTNLPNRLLLLDRLHQALARARRYGGTVGVLAFDLDRFKEVNDTYGHPVGDAVLRELAARVRALVRATDTPARIGGDEFALVAPDLADAGGAIRLAEKLLAACEPPVEVGGFSLPVAISVGIALFPDHGREVGDLLTGADIALYAAKAGGRGRWSIFSSDMRAAAQSRRRLETQLKEAVPGGQFRLVYQPRFALEDNRIVAAEALLRWQHPERGPLSPPDFIGVAEASGIIREIGHWVLRGACEQARRWRDQGMPVRVAVNLSAVEFRQPDLPDQIRAVLDEVGLEPSLLELEITESAYMDQRAAGLEDELRRVKDLGVVLAIDDFGTGYSSLAYLRWVPFDILKVDRSFVTNMGEDQRDEAIVRTIVALARNLDKTVVAEGVEKPHQLATLRRLGCHEAQGYLLGRPAPAEAVSGLLAA